MTAKAKTVCVTGASGFIASRVVEELLARGYHVHGTVRSTKDLSKYSYLTDLPGAGKRLKLFAADLLSDGSFDAAIKGCQVVFHMASPYTLSPEDPRKDLVDPAVNGTINVLKTAKKLGVKRVVLTSSMAAISDEPVEGKIFTEDDWNDKSSLTRNAYYYSKAEAERAAWRFVESEKPGFDLVVINPYMVIGPSLSPGLNASNAIFRDLLKGSYPVIMNLNWGFVDVRDAAKAHVLAMEQQNAAGRYLCSGDSLTMKQIVELLREAGYGENYKLPRVDMTNAFGDKLMWLMSYTQGKGVGSYIRTNIGKTMRYDNKKIKRDLGLRFHPARRTILETVGDLENAGHL